MRIDDLIDHAQKCYQAAKIDSEMDKIIDRDFDDTIADRFEKLQKMRERESAKIMALARSMRLTQQSQVDPERAHTASRKAAKKSTALWDAK